MLQNAATVIDTLNGKKVVRFVQSQGSVSFTVMPGVGMLTPCG